MTLKLGEPDRLNATVSPDRRAQLTARGSRLATDLLVGAALAVVYFIAGKVGLRFAFVNPSSTPVWPPTGIAFAALLLLGYRVWPAIFIGAFFVNVTTAGSIATSLAIAAGNTLEGLLGAYLVNRFANGRRVFQRAQDIFKFFVLAGLASTMVSETVGVTVLAIGGYARWQDYGPIAITWWLGDASGDLILAPLLVLWSERGAIAALRGRLAETIATLLLIIAVGLLVFDGLLPPGMRHHPIQFLCIPALIWTAFRFGQREAATAVAVLSAMAVWGTLHGFGPFAHTTPNESLLLLQAFMATMAVMTLPVAAVVWERKRLLQRERTAREAAEAASLAKDEFLAMLGHELRNPLGAILSAAYVLEHANDDAEQTATKARATIARQAQHLTRLVDDLLDVGRITTGRIALRRRAVNLADCVTECINALNGGRELDRHRVRTEVEPVWVDGDSDRLAQIVMNLLSNAIKFTPVGGSIAVSTKAENDRAVIRVQDSGVGIAPELLPRVFELFVQGESELHRSHSGLGIGLTLARRLVEMHGGTIEAASDGHDRGSNFTVRLLRIAAPESGIKTAKPWSRAESPRRILIIEDNADARANFRAALEMCGHQVLESADGQTGMEKVIAERPDVALVDIGLPGLNGYELARRVRSTPEGCGIVMIAVTGYGAPEDRRRAEQAGFDAFLVKPVEFDRLFELVATRRRTSS
jgi:signal transduction histidine kinase/CheY-like chemotaxis protein